MTPKEEKFVFQMIEELCKQCYALGYEDSEAGNPLKTEGFSMNKSSRLIFKTNLKKFTGKR